MLQNSIEFSTVSGASGRFLNTLLQQKRCGAYVCIAPDKVPAGWCLMCLVAADRACPPSSLLLTCGDP